MKLVVAFAAFVLFIVVFLIIGLYFTGQINRGRIQQPTNGVRNVAGPTAQCQRDSDCVRAGCSREVCTSRAAAVGLVTSCVYTPVAACRNIDVCGCVAGTCAWADTPAFRSCLAARQGAP